MPLWVAATGLVSDDGEPLAERGSEFGFRSSSLDVRFQSKVRNKSLNRMRDFAQACGMAEAQTRRMLIVDDDLAVLRIMREALQNFLHWEVDTSPKPGIRFRTGAEEELTT